MAQKFILSCIVIGVFASAVCGESFAMHGLKRVSVTQKEKVLSKKEAKSILRKSQNINDGILTIPNGYTTIGTDAFTFCEGFTSVVIPNSVKTIGVRAFNACEGLTSVTIPDSVSSIDFSAFYHCRQLTSVSIPSSIHSIGEHAFTYCSLLAEINVRCPDGVIDQYTRDRITSMLNNAGIKEKGALGPKCNEVTIKFLDKDGNEI